MDKLKDVGQDLVKALGEKAMSTVTDKVGGLTDKFDGIANGGPIGKLFGGGDDSGSDSDSDSDSDDSGDDDGDDDGPIKGALKGAVSTVKDKVTGGGGGSPKATKAINIIESIDVGVPLRVAYNQWTTWSEFPSFMKKVESADLEDGEEEAKVNFKAQIFLSHRSWQATIKQQKPDEIIVWTSRGDKGRVDGAVSFHELGPNLTRILVVLEYYPQGLFEWVGNRWRAQGRRARLEIKNFRRHVMTRTILDPDEVEGWRGTVEDGEVVTTHEEAMEQEEQDQDDQEDQGDEEGEEDEFEDSEDSDDSEEAEDADDADDAEDAEDSEDSEEEPDEEEEEEPAPRRRRRAS